MKVKGIFFTILSALLFGVTPILASMSYEEGSNPMTVTFYRNLMVVPILAVILLIRRTNFKLSRKSFLNLLIFAILGCGVTTLTLYSAYDYVGVGTATTLHFLYPLFVAIICRVFYKEKLTWQKLLALAIAAGGVVFFIERGGGSNAWLGIFLATGSSLTYAIYMVGMDKKGLSKKDPFLISFYIAVIVSVGMLLVNIPMRQIVFALSPKAFLLTFGVAMGTSLLGIVFLQIGIKHLNATTAAIFCLFEPVACSIAGVLFLHEGMTIAKIAGSVLILAAVVIIMVNPKSKKLETVSQTE